MIKKNYLEKIEKLVKDGVISRSAVTEVIVAHDDWCPMIRGEESCSCEPDIVTRDTIHAA